MTEKLSSQEIETKIHYPSEAVWEVTLACNLRCLHCGSSAGPLTARVDELTTKEALDIVFEFKGLDIKRVCFAGGEPFLRKDWGKLATLTAKLGMRPGFVSNGLLIDEKVVSILEKLVKAGVVVSLSIDGDQEAHDHIRQKKGAFEKVIKALSLLSEKGVPVSVITQVNKFNLKVLPKLRDQIFKYGIYAWQMQLATPWGRMGQNREFLLSPRDYSDLIDFYLLQRKIYKDRVCVPDNIGYFTEVEKELRPHLPWKGCQAGLQIFGLTSNGGVTGCLSLQEPRFIEGNIRKRKLKDIWFDQNLFSYNRKFQEKDLKGFCGECVHRAECRGGCKSSAYAFSGSLFENYYCMHRIKSGGGVLPEKIKLRDSSGAGEFHP